jgi:hypothetical protein
MGEKLRKKSNETKISYGGDSISRILTRCIAMKEIRFMCQQFSGLQNVYADVGIDKVRKVLQKLPKCLL